MKIKNPIDIIKEYNTNSALMFKHPLHGEIATVVGLVWLWVLLLNGIYFGVKNVWKHLIITSVIAVVVIGIVLLTSNLYYFGLLSISWLIYPFFAKSIIKQYYQQKGWIQIETKSSPE